MIGMFDSGSGGLSVLREVVKLLPGERYVYYSDNAHCPYGEKTAAYIQDRAREITRLLMAKGCNLIVVACNTATGAAIKQLREEFPIPFIGMEPAVKPAALGTKSGVIGVLEYLDTKGRFQDEVKIVEHVGSGFVELVENGVLDGPEAEAVVEHSLRPLLDAGADIIVLGCTHYPFLMEPIRRIAGPEVRIIDPAPAVARQVVNVLEREGIPYQKDAGALAHPDIELLSSGDPASLQRIFALVS